MNSKFWSGKRVFLTGHTGFKGSWMALWLQSLGAELTGFSLTPLSDPSLFEVAKVSGGMKSIISDIRDFETLKKAVHDSKPEIVIHMAAQSLVRHSYTNPVETYSTNVMGTVNILEVVRSTNTVKAVVIITSDKCYENLEWAWGYREDDLLGGYDPYSNSKGCAELATAAYRTSFFNEINYSDHGVAIATARAGNVIGGGDWSTDRLIPDLVRSIVLDKEFIIRNPKAIRPWQHVLEPLSGYLLLAEKLYSDGARFAQAWNFGPADDDVKSVQWIIDKFLDDWGGVGKKIKIEQSATNLHEASLLKLDCSKARMSLSWKPLWNINEVLERICLWHKAHLDGEDMRMYSLSEINQYQINI
jgi:CDP-glucose 4,6-dehydratase